MTNPFDLKDRVVFITGIAKGIGAKTAEMLAEAGAIIEAGDIDAKGAEATASRIAKSGGRIGVHALDVREDAQWQAAMAAVKAKHGKLDGLVNNAGIIMMKPLSMTTLEDWRRVNGINVEGTFLGCKHAQPLLAAGAKARGGWSSIVNLSSVYGYTAAANFSAYCASKGAVRLLAKSLALEFARDGSQIRVNSVHPGPIDTDLGTGPLKQLEAAGILPTLEAGKAAVQMRYPMGRWGEDHDIASVVLFLLTDAAKFVTGADIVADGGWSVD